MKKNSSRLLLLSLTLMILLSVNVFAAEVSDLLNKKITLDAEDASVSTIISTMARLSGCNIVLAMDTETKDEKSEEQKITIHIEDVPIEQALALVVKSIGLSYRLVGEKTFIVGERGRIEEEIGERMASEKLTFSGCWPSLPRVSIKCMLNPESGLNKISANYNELIAMPV